MASQEETIAASLLITGRVQGVGYRAFAQEAAQEAGLVGWVRNLSNGDVEAHAEGNVAAIEQWTAKLRQGPPLSRVGRISVQTHPPTRQFHEFSIL
jgi:acylphosphatase